MRFASLSGILFFASMLSAAAMIPPAKTIQNLNAALQAEANASNRYMLYAQRAEDDGHSQVAKLFRATARSEAIHEENHRMAILSLGGNPQKPELKPVIVRDTERNLETPIRSEAQERSSTYPAYLQQARRDHADAAIRTFNYALNAETEHEKLFKIALANLGHNPNEDYYVSRVSGDTVANPAGKPLAKASPSEYIQIA